MQIRFGHLISKIIRLIFYDCILCKIFFSKSKFALFMRREYVKIYSKWSIK
jgi:hypothetical protein